MQKNVHASNSSRKLKKYIFLNCLFVTFLPHVISTKFILLFPFSEIQSFKIRVIRKLN